MSARASRPGHLGHLIHLVRRFVGSWSSRPPSPVDEAWVDAVLLAGERRLWIQLGNADRRHAIEVARRYQAHRPEAERAELAGALLHDIGKLQSSLGVMARVAATVLGPRGPRFRAYHEHEALGAQLCEGAGSEPVTVRMVAGDGSPEVREALQAADAT